MAAIPKPLAETPRRPSSSSSRKGVSHGRGGAGNLKPASDIDSIKDIDLATPTLKSEIYTTGRGGSGNMAKNTDAEKARKAQDVVAAPRRESESNTHVGRGGAANVFRPSQDDIEKAKRDNALWESAVDDRPQGEKGLAEKGKDWLLKKAGKA